MATLQKSMDKRNALIRATVALVNKHWFHPTAMSKIAKMQRSLQQRFTYILKTNRTLSIRPTSK